MKIMLASGIVVLLAVGLKFAPALCGKCAQMGEMRAQALAAQPELDAKTGGTFALLERIEADNLGSQAELVRDAIAFNKLFQRDDAKEYPVAASELTADSFGELVDGTTITFPAGVFDLTAITAVWRDLPRDLTLRGAGIDETLIVLSALQPQWTLKNFRAEDCTLYSESGFLDAEHPTSASFERVRFTGFETAIDANNGLALLATDCIFAGGYGREPGAYALFDAGSGAILARFDTCRFEQMRLGTGHTQNDQTTVFTACEFEETLDLVAPTVWAKRMPNIVFEDGAPAERLTPMPPRVGIRDLGLLFPNWKAETER